MSGSGCPGGQPATVTLDGVGVVTAPTAGATGDFAATVNVPAGATAGPYTVTVTCGRGTVVLGVTLTAVVVAPQSNPATPVTVRGSLPLTGTDPQLLIMLGLLTLAAGLALTVAARFRRQG